MGLGVGTSTCRWFGLDKPEDDTDWINCSNVFETLERIVGPLRNPTNSSTVPLAHCWQSVSTFTTSSIVVFIIPSLCTHTRCTSKKQPLRKQSISLQLYQMFIQNLPTHFTAEDLSHICSNVVQSLV